MHPIWMFALLAASLCGPFMAAVALDEPVASGANQSINLDDPIEPLQPIRQRGGGEADRIRAQALFASARVAEQKQDYPLALRNYERAWRFDPDAQVALREIVPLAFNLDRQAEAVRYALIMAEREPTDPVLLRRLATYLAEDGQSQRALKFYEKALAIEANEKPSANRVLLEMELGRLCFVTRQFEPAAHYFAEVEKALDHPREHGLDTTVEKALRGRPELTYQLFGESFLEANRPTEALAAFEKSHQAKPDDSLRAYNLARVDAKRKQPAQALAKLQTYFDRRAAGQGTEPYQLLADLLAELGQAGQLPDRLETLRSNDPDNLPLTFFLAQHYRQAGQLDKAEPLYAGLIERHKSRPPLEAHQSLLEIYCQRKDATKILLTLGDTVGRVGSLAPMGQSAKNFLADGQLVSSTLAEARRLLENDPDALGYGARLAAALLSAEQKDFALAKVFYDAALKADPTKASEVLVNWGLELFMAGQFQEAIKIFERALAEKVLPENNPTLHFYLAGALEMIGSTDQAIEEANKAAALQSDSPRMQSRVAWIQYHAKRHAAARRDYLALLEKFGKVQDPSDARDVLRDARLVLSNIAVIEGNLAESEEWIEQVLDEFPEDVGALNDLGYLWADSGKHLERALQMIDFAVRHEPKNMAYRDSLGWVLFRLGRFDEAIAELKVAAAVDEPDGVILDHLAEAHLKKGDRAAAIEHWQRAVAAFEKQADPEKAKHSRAKIEQARSPAKDSQ